MDLLTPCKYRLKPAQEAWLRQRANRQGHGIKAITLRMLIDQLMKAEASKRKNGGRKQRAA